MKTIKNPFTKVNAQMVATSITCNVLGTAHFVLQAGADICKEAEAELVFQIMKDQAHSKPLYKQGVREVRELTYARDIWALKLGAVVIETKLENAKAKLAGSIENVRESLTRKTVEDDVPNFGVLQ